MQVIVLKTPQSQLIGFYFVVLFSLISLQQVFCKIPANQITIRSYNWLLYNLVFCKKSHRQRIRWRVFIELSSRCTSTWNERLVICVYIEHILMWHKVSQCALLCKRHHTHNSVFFFFIDLITTNIFLRYLQEEIKSPLVLIANYSII